MLKVRTRQGLHACFCVLLSISPVFYLLRTNSWQNQLGEGRVALSSQSGEVHHGEEGMAAGAWGSRSHSIHRQEAERDKCWCPVHSLLFSPSRSLVAPRTVLLGWVFPPQLAHSRNFLTDSPRGLSLVMLDPMKLKLYRAHMIYFRFKDVNRLKIKGRKRKTWCMLVKTKIVMMIIIIKQIKSTLASGRFRRRYWDSHAPKHSSRLVPLFRWLCLSHWLPKALGLAC